MKLASSVVAETFEKSLDDFLAKYSADKDAELNDRGFEHVTFSLLAYLKYLTSLVHPGEWRSCQMVATYASRFARL